MTINNYEKDFEGGFWVDAVLEDQADALVFQRLVRDAITATQMYKSAFGINKSQQEFLVLKYPFKQRFMFIYESYGTRISLLKLLPSEQAPEPRYLKLIKLKAAKAH